VTDSGDSEVQALEGEVQALRTENDRLRSLLGLDQPSRQQTAQLWEPTLFVQSEPEAHKPGVDENLPAEVKIALFRSLFSGRDDVHALRWESARTGKTGWSPAVVGGWANAKKPGRQ
jgi:hypothetical protein